MGRNKTVITTNITQKERELFRLLKYNNEELTWSMVVSRGLMSLKFESQNPYLNDIFENLPLVFKESLRSLYSDFEKFRSSFDSLMVNSNDFSKSK